MPTLDLLLSPADKARLSPAVSARYACRRYGAPLSLADWSALSYAAGRYRMPGVRLVLCRVDEALFAPSMTGSGQIAGCRAAAVIVAEQSQLRGRVYAGILGEAFCLEAAAMGLATCWLSDGYRERLLDVTLKPYEGLVCLIAVGHAASPIQPDRNRQTLERLCGSGVAAWPEQLRHAAELVRVAPSLRNLQPWQMKVERQRFIIQTSNHASIETGIAALHAELALTGPHVWHFGRGSWEDAAWVESPGGAF